MKKLYVIDQDANAVLIINPNTTEITHTIEVGKNPVTAAYCPVLQLLYVSCWDCSNTNGNIAECILYVIQVNSNNPKYNTVITTSSLGRMDIPTNIVVDPLGGNIYLTTNYSLIAVDIESFKVSGISFSGQGGVSWDCLVIGNGYKKLYVTDYASGLLSEIDISTNMSKSIEMQDANSGDLKIYKDPGMGFLYVIGVSNTKVYKIDPRSFSKPRATNFDEHIKGPCLFNDAVEQVYIGSDNGLLKIDTTFMNSEKSILINASIVEMVNYQDSSVIALEINGYTTSIVEYSLNKPQPYIKTILEKKGLGTNRSMYLI
jgi:YVTN family beta-propeller protein